jgi:hypothetical protein
VDAAVLAAGHVNATKEAPAVFGPATAAPYLADAAGFLLLALLLTPLSARLQTWSTGNVLLLAAVYLLFCGGVYLLRKLEPAPGGAARSFPAWWWSAHVQGSLGVLFGLTMMLAFTHQLGYLELMPLIDVRKMGSGEAAAFFGLAPAAWLAFSLLYTLLLVSSFETAVPAHSRYLPLLALASLLAGNLMLLLLAAEIRVLLAELGVGRNGWLFLPVLLALGLLFAPARLWFLSRQPQRGTAVTFTLLLLFAAYVVTAA